MPFDKESVILDRLIQQGSQRSPRAKSSSSPIAESPHSPLWSRLWHRLIYSLTHLSIPSRITRKVYFSLRVTWALSITLVASYYWQWSAYSMYVSPVVAVFSAVIYFGLWQSIVVSSVFGIIIGASLGVIVGYAYLLRPLQIVLLCFTITYINRYPGLDRGAIVNGCLSLILTTLYPTMTNGLVIGRESLKASLPVMLLPFIFTGASLLLPIPALAIYTAKGRALLICRKVSWLSNAMIRSFHASEEVDLRRAQFDQHVQEIQQELGELRELARYVHAERLLFPAIQDLASSLTALVDLATLLVSELQSVRDLTSLITFNSTQKQFAMESRKDLEDIRREIDLMLTIVGEYFQHFEVFPWKPLHSLYNRLCQCVGLYQSVPSDASSSSSSSSSATAAAAKCSSAHHDGHKHFAFEEHPQFLQTSGFASNESDPLQSKSAKSTASVTSTSERTHGFHHYSLNERDLEVTGAAAASATDSSDDSEEEQVRTRLNRVRNHMRKHLDESVSRALTARSNLIFHYYEVRRQFVFFDPHEVEESLKHDEEIDQQALDKQLHNESSQQHSLSVHEGERRRLRRRASNQQPTKSSDKNTSEEVGIEDVDDEPQSPNTRELTQHLQQSAMLQAEIQLLEERHIVEEAVSRSEHVPHEALSSLELPNTSEDAARYGRRVNLLKLAVREDNLRLGLRNLGPRAAYVHRISMLVQSLSQLAIVFDQRDPPRDLFSVSTKFLWNILQFFLDFGHSFVYGATYLYALARNWNNHEHWAQVHEDGLSFFMKNIQALKIGAVVAILTALLVYKETTIFYNNGLWSILVVILIRQENTSSSFFLAYQRIEGTVIGAIYSFLVFQFLECDTHACGKNIQIPVLLCWVFFCSLFRDAVHHGYAAAVASFTPIILIIGSNHTLDAAWGRIEQNFLGVFFYLVVDNVFLPRRTYPSITASVLACISQTRVVIRESIAAVETLMSTEIVADELQHHGHAMSIQLPQSMMSHLSRRSQSETDFLSSDDLVGIELSAAALNTELTAVECMDPHAAPAVTVETMRQRANTSISVSHRQRTDSVLSQFESNLIIGNTALISASEHDNDSLSTPLHVTNKATDLEHELVEVTRLESGLSRLSERQHRQCVDLFTTCKSHLNKSESQLRAMKVQLGLQKSLLSMVAFEPELWHAPFPQPTYTKLSQSFTKVHRSGCALNAGCRALSVLLLQMLKNNENVDAHLNHLRYMTKHLFDISGQAEQALLKTFEVFTKLYEEKDYELDLHSLLSLRALCESRLESVSDHFRAMYIRDPQTIATSLNPYFLVAWQNVFESASELIRDLSELGMTLHIVRDMEIMIQRQ